MDKKEMERIENDKLKNYDYSFVGIESIERLDDFDNEYVYDLEIDTKDENLQTFFSNDLLIHNSSYVSFKPIREALGFEGSSTELVLKLNKDLQPYLRNCFLEYAKSFGLKESFLDFELENISNKAVWLGKKKYLLNLVWKDNIEYDKPKQKFTGIEVIQKSTPKIARKTITDTIKWLFDVINYDLKDSKDFMSVIKDVKKEFKYCDFEDKCISTGIGEYDKFVLDDEKELILKKGCPIHVRAAANYNYRLFNSKLSNKYEKITKGSRVKWYLTDLPKPYNVFGFIAGSFPDEFAPIMDEIKQFEKCVFAPINRIASVTGLEILKSGGTVINRGNILDLVSTEVYKKINDTEK